jgi:predicted MFS family arabinose efflux permease
MGQGLAPWYAAFMMRSHGMGTAELGVWLGLIFGIGGFAGILFGGYVAATLLPDNEHAQVRFSAVSIGSLVVWYALFLLLPGKHMALMALAPLVAVFSFFLAPTFALMQRLVADEMRATTIAVVMLLANLIGMGAGPQIVGILSDVFAPMLGPDALRYSMLVMSLGSLWAALHFWLAGLSIREDLACLAA